MKRYVLNGTFYYCPVDLTLQIVGGRWKGLIIWNLRLGPMRYSALKRALVMVNDRTLSQALRELEAQGVVQRTAYEETPPKVDYRLTPLGNELLPIMQAMSNYGDRYSV